MSKIVHMISACLAAAGMMGWSASAEELRVRPKRGIWEFHFTRTYTYPESTPLKGRASSPCTLTFQASDTIHLVGFFRDAKFIKNSPARALQINTYASSHHSPALAKRWHLEGLFSTTALDLRKRNSRSYVLTETTIESRFNKWTKSYQLVTEARWIAKEWPPSKPTDVIQSAAGPHGEWLWDC